MEIYYLALSAANCKYEIRINDFSLFKEIIGYQLNTESAFNQLVFKPAINIDIDISPINNQSVLNQLVSFELRVYSKTKGQENETTHYEYRFLDSEKSLPNIKIQKIINIKDVKYIPVWAKGEKVEINHNTISELYTSYKTLWTSLKNNDIKHLKEIIALREETYAYSFGNPLEERYEFAISTYKSHIHDSDYHLFDFRPESFKPKLQCLGKVVSLEDEEGFQPVFFLKNDKQGSISIPAYYSKIDGTLKIVL